VDVWMQLAASGKQSTVLAASPHASNAPSRRQRQPWRPVALTSSPLLLPAACSRMHADELRLKSALVFEV
jgi:hypothetical protein